ncbi:MAG TPA: phage holin family protein [Opitutaceae bacterium]|nr:phage holin family protein [Opitutaceae bacterium]
MRSPLKQLLLRWLVLAVGVMLATNIVRGIQYDDALTLFCVVVLLSFFNAILKPLLVLFTLPFIVVTMGFGVVVINALLFLLVGRILQPHFIVSGFWSAVGGSLVVSITNWLASAFVRSAQTGSRPPPPPPPPSKPDDVIDI